MKPQSMIPNIINPCRLLALVLLAITPVASAQEAKSGFKLTREADSAADAGKWEEAEKLMTIAVAKMREESGPDHPSVGMNLRYLAEIQARRGRIEECIRSLSESTTLLEKSLGKENPMAFSARYLWLVELRRAKRSGEAAGVAGELFGTLSAFVQSGRAKDASLDKTNLGNGILQVKPDEGGLADVASLWGLSLVASGKDAEARPVLLDSLARIEKLFGAGHPRAVEVQQALEKIALAKGDGIGRRYVGELGSTRLLAFEGNTQITSDNLRKALAKDAATVLASHPSAPFSDYLDILQRSLTSGFLDSGFPEAKVTAAYDTPANAEPRILVRISEGPRFRNGKVTVSPPDSPLARSLVESLVAPPKAPADPLLSKVEKELNTVLTPENQKSLQPWLDEVNKSLPTARIASGNTKLLKEDSKTAPILDSLFQKSATPSTDVFWEAGEPTGFGPGAEFSIVSRVRHELANLGYPAAKWKSQLVRQTDGTCDLVFTEFDPGPQAIIASVKVQGNKKNTEEQILRLTGFQAGATLKGDSIGKAKLALWNSGRFWPFTLIAVPRGPATPEIDLVIGVQEIQSAPALDAALTEVQQAVMVAAREFSPSFATRSFHFSGQFSGFDFAVAHLPGQRVLGKIGNSRSPSDSFLFSGDKDSLQIVVRTPSGPTLLTVPLQKTELVVTLATVPGPQAQGTMELFMRAGMRSGVSVGSSSLSLEMLAFPGFPFLTKLDLSVANGVMTASSKGQTQFTTDASSGLLRSIAGFPVSFDDAKAAALLAEWEAALQAGQSRRTVMAWSELFARGLARSLRVLNEPSPENSENPTDGFAGVKQGLAKTLNDWLPGGKALSPETIDAAERTCSRLLFPLLGQLSNLTATDDGDAGFTIPPGENLKQGAVLPLLLGFGYAGLVEDCLPSGSWASTLSRELMFHLAGNSRYTATTLDQLLEDSTMGPFGCLLSAQLISNVDSSRARRFQEKALKQCTAQGFRQDWQLALADGSGFSKSIFRLLETVEKLSPSEEADIILLIGKEREPWLKDFLSALRTRPQDQPLAERLAPHLDKLWDQHLGPAFKDNLNRHLHPPVDATKVAAVVNGGQLPRRMVEYLRLVGVPLPGSAGKEPGGDTWNIARRDLIRMGLVHRDFILKGSTIDAAKMESGFISQLPPDLKDADDTAFLKRCGITKSEALSMFQLNLVLNEMILQFTRTLPPPSAEEVARWSEGPGKGISDEVHLHKVRLPWPDGCLFSGKHTAAQRTQALRSALLSGFPDDLLTIAAEVDGESIVEYSCVESIAVHALMPSLSEELARVPDGGWSIPVAESNKFCLLHPVIRTPGKLPDGEYGTLLVQGLARRHQHQQALAKWFEQLESQATIEILDGPRPDAESHKTLALQSAAEWAKSTPASLLARLTHLWLLLPKKDPAAINAAMDAVLALPSLTPEHSAALAKALVKAGHPDLAERAKRRVGGAP